MQAATPALVLASGSAARRDLLVSCGLRAAVCPSGIDEDLIKSEAAAQGATAEATALRLARAKAGAIVAPGALVLGCDQILVCEDRWFDKPATPAAARTQLQALRGRRHRLATAVVAWRDGSELWQHLATPTLTMRTFSDEFLDCYLRTEGAAVLTSVGAYRLEGPGIHLFDAIEGDHSAILGLPLLPLLAFLRRHGVLLA